MLRVPAKGPSGAPFRIAPAVDYRAFFEASRPQNRFGNRESGEDEGVDAGVAQGRDMRRKGCSTTLTTRLVAGQVS